MGKLEVRIALITGARVVLGWQRRSKFVSEGAQAFITGRRDAA